MAKAKKIPATKTSRITIGHNHYKLEPATSRTHYGEYRQDRGGQPYAFPSKHADEAWFVVSDWSGNRHGLVQQWGDGEWSFSKIEGSQQTPSWLRAYYHDTPATIFNLSSRLHTGSTPEEAIARGLGLSVSSAAPSSHATIKEHTPRKTSAKRRSEISVGDCVVMREPHRKFITSSTGSAVFKVVELEGNAITIEGPLDWHPKHRRRDVMGAHQFKTVPCPVDFTGSPPHAHASRRSRAQLDREIAQVLGRRRR